MLSVLNDVINKPGVIKNKNLSPKVKENKIKDNKDLSTKLTENKIKNNKRVTPVSKDFLEYSGKTIARNEKEIEYQNELNELKVKEKLLVKELKELRLKINAKQREKRRFSDRLRKQLKKDKPDGNNI